MLWHVPGRAKGRLIFVPLKPDSVTSAAIEKLQKQVDDIVQELNLLKEKQALQTGMFLFMNVECSPQACLVLWDRMNI